MEWEFFWEILATLLIFYMEKLVEVVQKIIKKNGDGEPNRGKKKKKVANDQHFHSTK